MGGHLALFSGLLHWRQGGHWTPLATRLVFPRRLPYQILKGIQNKLLLSLAPHLCSRCWRNTTHRDATDEHQICCCRTLLLAALLAKRDASCRHRGRPYVLSRVPLGFRGTSKTSFCFRLRLPLQPSGGSAGKALRLVLRARNTNVGVEHAPDSLGVQHKLLLLLARPFPLDSSVGKTDRIV